MTVDDMVNALRGDGAKPDNSQTNAKEREGPPAANGTPSPGAIISILGGHVAPKEGAEELRKDLQAKERKKRSFTLKEREAVESFSAGRPNVNLEVYFDYNSAEITDSARTTLKNLGLALQSPQLAGMKFIFRGHTDAHGDADYNLHLSDRRAVAIKSYIVRAFNVNERNIVVIGDGALHLKNKDNP